MLRKTNKQKVLSFLQVGRILRFKTKVKRFTARYKYHRLFFVSLLALVIIAGLNPFAFLQNVIKALGGAPTATIDLYANSIVQDKVPGDFSQGWWNLDKAIHEQDLAPTADLINFSDQNSAFYNGGDFSLVTGDFDFSKDLKLINNDTGEIQVGDNAAASSNASAEVIASTSSDYIDSLVSTTSSEFLNNNNGTTTEDTPSSMFDDKPQATLIGMSAASAQVENNNDFGRVGVFKSAKINLSFALRSLVNKMNPVENSAINSEEVVPAVPEEDSSGSTTNINNPSAATQDNSSSLPADDSSQPSVNSGDANSTDNSAGAQDSGQVEILDKPAEASAVNTDDSPTVEIQNNNLSVPTSDSILSIPAQDNSQGEQPVSRALDNSELWPMDKLLGIKKAYAQSQDSIPSAPAQDNIPSASAQDYNPENKITFWYALNDEPVASTSDDLVWQKLDSIDADNISNFSNNGYLSYDAPFLKEWNDIKRLKIKVKGMSQGKADFAVYLDSLWVETQYEPNGKWETLEEKRARWQAALEMLTDGESFKFSDPGLLKFRYNKNKKKLLDSFGQILGLSNFWKDVTMSIELQNQQGEKINMPLTLFYEDDGQFSIRLPDLPRGFKPGKYKLKFVIQDDSGDQSETIELDRDFSWGVLALNYNKSVYTPLEKALLQVGVLDDFGHTLCDAELEIKITPPSGNIITLSTGDGSIKKNPDCAPKSITNYADYSTEYQLGGTGEYQIKLSAKTANGLKVVYDKLEVRDMVALDIERIGPTRINPAANYAMEIKIKANQDYTGSLAEYVPANFKILDHKVSFENMGARDPFSPTYGYAENTVNEDEKTLNWNGIEMKAGDTLTLEYTFDAPDISPEMFEVGPLTAANNPSTPPRSASFEPPQDQGQGGNNFFKEERRWEIASDAVTKKAKTVMFLAGIYNGQALIGQSANNNQTFATFNFQLAETGVQIKNAFISFESQFEAYANNVGNYSYTLAFDSCQESCTADAFAGSGKTLKADASVLANNGTESNEARIILDVTNESQLAAYTGDGVNMQGQVGYKLDNTSAGNSIASAKAILHVTYTYDDNSPNITNTIIYPLDSTNANDNGTRQASVATSSCWLDSGNCPYFDYSVSVPEFPGISTSTYRLSQWFNLQNANDGNTVNDVNTDVNIQGTNVNSSFFHLEGANGGSQGNSMSMYFDNVSGFAENTAQTLEMHATSSDATFIYFMMGGEVFDTYVASSSAAVKTRTVSYPLGVLNSGLNAASFSKTANVYFPENGTATGTVKIKSAWVRIISNHYNTGAFTLTASAKVGAKATSTPMAYVYNPSGTVVKPSFEAYYIIPATNTVEMEDANKNTAVPVRVTTLNPAAAGGVSAELMITYTYSGEGNGYLSSLQLYGGQSDVTASTSATSTAANSVLPELSGKTVRAAGLLTSFLNSDSTGVVPNNNLLIGSGFGTSASPSCSKNLNARLDSVNGFNEFYQDISGTFTTTDNQAYYTAFCNDGSLSATGGAKMNGIISYTYQWDDSPPTGTISTSTFAGDGSGTVRMGIKVNDIDAQDVRAKLEYSTSTQCDFTYTLDPTLDESDSTITASFGTPGILNSNIYQIGTTDAYMVTASGTNTVGFNWNSRLDEPDKEGTYCLRLTANDKTLDQVTPATSTVYIDNKKPTAPGAVSMYSRTGTTTVLNLGATTTETNFMEYKIYYKLYDGSAPTESDSVQSSSTKSFLGNKLFSGVASTTIDGLTAKQTYSFAIWAYDWYGNKASSSRVDITTNDAPTGLFNSAAQITDGSGIAGISIEVNDNNNDNTVIARLDYAAGSACNFSTPLDPNLDETQANIQADFGVPKIDNNQVYQIGSTSGYILTSGGSNTVNFDWLEKINEASADGTYCLRLTTNDSLDDQLKVATTTIVLDNIKPTITSSLTATSVDIYSARLLYATSSPASDTNQPSVDAYRIFYKQGTSGVTRDDSELNSTDLDAYNYKGATSTLLSGLQPDTNYVVNIWSFDVYGNMATSTEISFKTKSTLNNDSLAFTNATSTGPTSNIAVSDNVTDWNFRTVVSEVNGWNALDFVRLRLADSTDNSSPFGDLVFNWDQSTKIFTEVGSDALSAVTLSPNSTTTCAVNTCTLDFKLRFNKAFTATSTVYSAEVYSQNDSAKFFETAFADIFQVRTTLIVQTHVRWRNNDGGE